MSRRTPLPGADELFRVTSPAAPPASPEVSAPAPPAAPAEDDERSRRRAEPAPQPEMDEGGRDDDELADLPPGRRRVAVTRRSPRGGQGAVDRRSTGRERHEEKITVYVSPEELFDLEHARLVLRGEHGIASDRGRIVREAIAVVLADLDAKGSQSILVRRLSGR